MQELRDKTAIWKTWDILTSLCQYKVIGCYLGQFCSVIANTDPQAIADVISVDIDVICVRLFIISNDPKELKRLVGLRDDNAQVMLDLLQTVRYPYMFLFLLFFTDYFCCYSYWIALPFPLSLGLHL